MKRKNEMFYVVKRAPYVEEFKEKGQNGHHQEHHPYGLIEDVVAQIFSLFPKADILTQN